jgi:5-formyltetrahydrofolate cyclo-ligase
MSGVPDGASSLALRRSLRARRRRLTPEEQQQAAAHLAKLVATTHAFQTSRRIACYFPNDGEIDPTPLMRTIWSRRKVCYLPVLSRLSHDRLWFAPVWPETAFAPNKFGIPEPLAPLRSLVRAAQLDLILTPLVGFDAHGNRLGMGGGYYDRSLAFLRGRRHWRKPRLLGIAHECQRVDKLIANPWDIPLDGVITDRRAYLAPRGA